MFTEKRKEGGPTMMEQHVPTRLDKALTALFHFKVLHPVIRMGSGEKSEHGKLMVEVAEARIAAANLRDACQGLLDACDAQSCTNGVTGEVLTAMEQARAVLKEEAH
jgi:hypothetical protein